MRDDNLPPDPDLDDLAVPLEPFGPLTIVARDPKTGKLYSAPTTQEDVAAGLADRRRQREDDAAR